MTRQYIVRAADRKSCAEIAAEIHAAKTGGDNGSGYVFSTVLRTFLTAIPRRASGWLMRSLLRNHAKVRDLSGTAFVTSVSMFSNVPGYVIPYIGGPKAVSIALGSAVKKPVVRRDGIVVREMINMTVVFNHGIVDGPPPPASSTGSGDSSNWITNRCFSPRRVAVSGGRPPLSSRIYRRGRPRAPAASASARARRRSPSGSRPSR